ncbi:hypothetical protein SAMN05216298_3107 [Glycomyces sambucus]|uniref:Uncharacterized protein n=2 Tax=Glycomyces sambucus TaxID=380244 RepID=A0A1G9I974_9ACTN|nr:hypothetical protein SAMN05216298_3107 [Glycomyces sambucus]
MEAALAAAAAEFPAATDEPALAALFSGSRARYDAGTHTVILIGPSELLDGTVEGIFETCPGRDLPSWAPYTENLQGTLWTGWEADNTETVAAIERIAQIFAAAERARVLARDRPSTTPDADVYWELERRLDRLKEQAFVLEAVKVRLVRDRLAAASSGAEREAIAKEVHLSFAEWQQLLVADHIALGTLTGPPAPDGAASSSTPD